MWFGKTLNSGRLLKEFVKKRTRGGLNRLPLKFAFVTWCNLCAGDITLIPLRTGGISHRPPEKAYATIIWAEVLSGKPFMYTL